MKDQLKQAHWPIHQILIMMATGLIILFLLNLAVNIVVLLLISMSLTMVQQYLFDQHRKQSRYTVLRVYKEKS